MRLPTLLFILLLCTGVRAQQSRIDTVSGPFEGMLTYRFITEVPDGSKLSKAERFIRGLTAQDSITGWDQLDSIQVVDAVTGEQLPQEKLEEMLKMQQEATQYRRAATGKPQNYAAARTLYLYTNLVILDGRIGEPFRHQVAVRNASDQQRTLVRTDSSAPLEVDQREFAIEPASELEIEVSGKLTTGSTTYPFVLENGDSLRLEVRFVFNGHDINEEDFVASRKPAELPVWVVPNGRETLYLRLRSTEKLMTIYRDGKVYNKIAVGRQLDELSLIGLAPGKYLLEVIDLRTGQKRYHGLHRP